MELNVSIILINYNTLELTKQCIDSIISQTHGVTYEIILVDNHSTDGSYDSFINDDRIVYLYNEENLGFGQANNIGLTVAKGEYLFLLNSDTVLLNNAVYIFYNRIKEMESVGCIGTMLLDENENITLSYGKFPTCISVFYHRAVCAFLHKKSGTIDPLDLQNSNLKEKEVDYVVGADLFLKKDTALRYGLFDPCYFLFYEETDMQRRYNELKLKNFIIKGPKIIHIGSGSTTRNKYVPLSRIEIDYISSFRYLKKWAPAFSYFIFRIAFFLCRVTILLLNPKFPIKDKIVFFKHMIS